MAKIATSVVKFGYSNSYFSKTTDSISCIIVIIDSFQSAVGCASWKFNFLGIWNVISWNFSRCYSCWYFVCIATHNSLKLLSWALPQRPHPTVFFFAKTGSVFLWKSIFVCSIKFFSTLSTENTSTVVSVCPIVVSEVLWVSWATASKFVLSDKTGFHIPT